MSIYHSTPKQTNSRIRVMRKDVRTYTVWANNVNPSNVTVSHFILYLDSPASISIRGTRCCLLSSPSWSDSNSPSLADGGKCAGTRSGLPRPAQPLASDKRNSLPLETETRPGERERVMPDQTRQPSENCSHTAAARAHHLPCSMQHAALSLWLINHAKPRGRNRRKITGLSASHRPSYLL